MHHFTLLVSVFAIGSAFAAPKLARNGPTGNAPLDAKLFDSFKFYAQHAAAAYCNVDKSTPGEAAHCDNNGCPRLQMNNVSLVATAKGLVTGIGAYVAIDHVRQEHVVSVRGTTNIRNFITDAQFGLMDAHDITPGAKVHSGFLKAWSEISVDIERTIQSVVEQYPQYRLIVIGHSLGSGTALVGAAFLRKSYKIDYFGYGVPRVGNGVFADFVSNQNGGEYRIEHFTDVVSNLPPLLLDYRHTNVEYWLSTGPVDKIDYTIDEVKICEGNANLSCSGSVLPDVTARTHRYILADLYSCGGLQIIP